MLTPHHTIPAPPFARARAVARRALRRVRPVAPTLYDRWGDDAGGWTAGIAPLTVALTLTTAGASASARCTGYGAAAVQLAGQWRGHVCFEGSDDGVRWRPLPLIAHVTGTATAIARRPGLWRVPGGHLPRYFRVRVGTLAAGTVRGYIAIAPPAPTTATAYRATPAA